MKRASISWSAFDTLRGEASSFRSEARRNLTLANCCGFIAAANSARGRSKTTSAFAFAVLSPRVWHPPPSTSNSSRAPTGASACLMRPALRAVLTGAGSFDGRQPALATLAIGAVKGAAYLAQFYLVGLFGQRVVMDLRRRVFERLLGLSPRQMSAQL